MQLKQKKTMEELQMLREEMELKAKDKPNYDRYKSYYDYDRLVSMFAYGCDFKAEFHNGVLIDLTKTNGKRVEKINSYFEEQRINGLKDIKIGENPKPTGTESLGNQLWFVGHAKKAIQTHYDSGNYVSINQNEDRDTISTIYYTKELRSMIKKTVYAVDIKRCYWNIAIKKGILPNSLIEYSDDKKIRKDTGNITIGSLGRVVVEVEVKNGIIVEVKEKRSVLNRLRLDVIDYAWELACEMYFKHGKIGMFLTDCWFCEKEVVGKITKDLEDLGFQYSVKPVEILQVLNMPSGGVKVHWYDETKENEYMSRPEDQYSYLSFSKDNKLINY